MTAEPSGEPEPAPVSLLVDEPRLLAMTNRQLDALFRASPSGDIPSGNMRGTVLMFPGTAVAKPLAAAIYLVAWQGKVVSHEHRLLKNKVTPLRLRLIPAQLDVVPSWVDDRDCVVLDYSRTSEVARMVRDEIRLVAPGLYLGVVWMWHKRVGWFTLRSPVGES
jgi:hypothetical protein